MIQSGQTGADAKVSHFYEYIPMSKSPGKPLNILPAVERLKFALEYVEDFNVRRPIGIYPYNLEITRGIDDWAIANLCYCGLEQAMKLVIRSRCSDEETECLIRKDGHDLAKLYNKIGCAEKQIVAKYYRVYRSLYQRTNDGPPCETAEKFVQQIGNDYVAWRYNLTEDQPHPPRLYARCMLEIWRALLKIVDEIRCGYIDFHRLDRRISNYFETHIIVLAADQMANMKASCNYWRIIDDWVEEQGGYLCAGLHVFKHLHDPEKYPIDLEEELQEQILKLARESTNKRDPKNQFSDGRRMERWEEIIMLNCMCSRGLEWDHEDGIFKFKDEVN